MERKKKNLSFWDSFFMYIHLNVLERIIFLVKIHVYSLGTVDK